MKINKPELVLYTLAVLFFAMLVSLAFYYSSIQKDDAVRINLAGRQRMLSQKIAKEILLFGYGKRSPESIIESVDLFSQTQEALTNGGPAPISLDAQQLRVLPKLKDRGVMSKLLEVEEIWKPEEELIRRFLSTRDEKPVEYICTINEILLDKITESVDLLQRRSEKNSAIIRVIIIALFVFIFAILALSLYRKIKELRKAGERISELEKLLPICGNCKKIRINDEKPMENKNWTSIEEYLHKNKDMKFTHTICPECMAKLYPDIKISDE